jgi:dihydrolipoamide dehydrogenase
MPSKALLRPPEVLAEARRVPGAADAAQGELAVQRVLDRRDEVIHDLDDSSQVPWLEDRGVALLRGSGEIVGERRVRVGEQVLEARRAVVVATGSRPAFPPIEGVEALAPWTNREITTAKHVPESIVMVGGGVVGCEMAQAWQSLGAQVTLVEGERRLLPREEEFACAQVTEALEELGVTIACGQKAVKAERMEGGVRVTTGDGATYDGTEIVVALGRLPNTDGIGLEAVGIEAGGALKVDAHMQVPGHAWLYAIGDVNGRAPFTHMGKYQARVAGEHILGRPAAREHLGDGPGSPRVIFTDPQVAAVGHTLAAAEKAGIRARAVDVETSGNAGGSFYGRGAAGTARIVVDEDRQVIVGATITGAEVPEALHAATIAVVGEVPLDRLWHAVPCFPTRSELWLQLLEGYGL